MKIRVDVTQDDIDKGRPDDCAACPVALALGRAAGGAWWVQREECCPRGRGLFAHVPVPEAARAFIARFDEAGGRDAVAPFAFDLDVPDECVLG